jgi:hypothetical protein
MSGGLFFDIDLAQLRAVGVELGASEKQVKFALSAALRRTVTTLRTMAARGLASELQLRTISLLRKRLKSMRARMTSGDGVSLWFGLNDMPASWFKGRAKQTKTGAGKQGQEFAGAFVAKSRFKGRVTVFKRTSKARLHIAEQNLAVADRATVFIEDEIFEQLETIFWKNFRRDLAARVKFNIGGV